MYKDKNSIDEQLYVVKASRDYAEHEIFEGDILIVDDSKTETDLICIHEGPQTAGIIAKHEVGERHLVIGGVVERIRSYRNAVCEV